MQDCVGHSLGVGIVSYPDLQPVVGIGRHSGQPGQGSYVVSYAVQSMVVVSGARV